MLYACRWKNYQKAFEYCKKAADMGDANAINSLNIIGDKEE